MKRVREWLGSLTGGEATTPLLVLFGLNLVDEFDRIAFAALAPEIRDEFGLTDSELGGIVVFTAIFVLLSALPMGVLADRSKRVRLAFISAVLWGVMSMLTGIVPAIGLLVLVRLLAGLGRVVNGVVHPSLLADFYKPEHHPKVFFVHRLADPLSAVSGVIAGAIASLLSWEWAFIILALPTFALLLAVRRLREPQRGESIDAQLAAEAAAEAPVPFAEARRQLFAIRTLRRLYLGSFLLGVAALTLAVLLSLFFEEVYGYGSLGRGFVQFVFGSGAIAGLVVGARLANRAIGAGNLPRLATIVGLSFVEFGVGLVLMATAPFAAVSLICAFLLAMGLGSYQPAYFPLIGMVVPPRIRSQAYGWSILYLGMGGVVGLALFSIGEDRGYRVAVAVLGVIIVLAGFVGSSSSRFVARDVVQARDALAAAIAMRSDLEQTGSRALLSCSGVEVAYDQVQVLFGVNLEVRPGEIVALLGTNGAGKSTLLRAISGTVDPIGGSIFFEGRDITHADAGQTVAAGIIQVPGGKAVFPTLTVAEHLRAAGWLYRRDAEYLKSATDEVLRIFPRLDERIGQLAGNLSGGEQQMLALAMAFIAKPRLLMIDELSLGLAPTIVEQLLGVVRRIRDNGTAIVLVEQSLNVALSVADRAYFLEKGEVRFEGETADLLERDDIVRSVFLSRASRGPAPVSTVGNGDGNGRGSRIADYGVALEVSGLRKTFGGIVAVDDTSFAVGRNEILGLIGANGAGKTTIFDLISGFLVPDDGEIILDDVAITRLSPDRRAWLGLGRSFQDARLIPSLTVAENIALSLERHLEVRDPVASALSLPGVVRSEEDVAWTVQDLVELMGLGAYRDKFVRELSTGTRRVVDLAMCLAHDPKVLLLDEPSSGIAQRETEALAPLLRRIQDETGCALLVIEHDMPLITSISDRMIALELGRPIVEGSPDEVTSDERVVASYLGGDVATINRSGRATTATATATKTRTKATKAAKVKKAAKKKPAAKKTTVKKAGGKKATAKKAAPRKKTS